MKNIITIILAAALFIIIANSNTLAQSPLQVVKRTVGNTEILKKWNVGETKYVHDAVITRMAGVNSADQHTNAFYTSNKTLVKLLKEKAKTEQLSEKEEQMLAGCTVKKTGGQVALFFERSETMLAGAGYFTVEIQNEFGETLFVSRPHEKLTFYKWEVWYGYVTIDVPVELGSNFTIHVTDDMLDQTFTFKVTVPDQPENISISAMR